MGKLDYTCEWYLRLSVRIEWTVVAELHDVAFPSGCVIICLFEINTECRETLNKKQCKSRYVDISNYI